MLCTAQRKGGLTAITCVSHSAFHRKLRNPQREYTCGKLDMHGPLSAYIPACSHEHTHA